MTLVQLADLHGKNMFSIIRGGMTHSFHQDERRQYSSFETRHVVRFAINAAAPFPVDLETTRLNDLAP